MIAAVLVCAHGGLRVIGFTQQDVVHTACHLSDAISTYDDTPCQGLCARFALLCITLFGLQKDAIGDTRTRALVAHVNVWLCTLCTLLVEAPLRCVLGRPVGRDRGARRDVRRAPLESDGTLPRRVGRAPPM